MRRRCPPIRPIFVLAALLAWAGLAGCRVSTGSGLNPAPTPTTTATPTPSPTSSAPPSTTAFHLKGTITYDWVSAASPAEGGPALAYGGKLKKPVRRAVVQALQGGTVVTEGRTDDQGRFDLSLPAGSAVTVRVLARMQATAYQRDSGGSAHCNGASWDVKVVDNRSSKALYTATTSTVYNGESSSLALNVPLAFGATGYTKRSAAPFAILDTVLSEFELICQAQPATFFPLLTLNWSPDNRTDNDGGTYYTQESDGSNIYILGEEDVDTDEYDDHVVAHEVGHYIEEELYRSDSIGGGHRSADSLDPRVAFGEGYGNAIAGMVFNDPVYVDTNSQNQAGGFTISVNLPPAGDDRGVYSETSVQYLLWKLFENRRISLGGDGGFDRLHAVLRDRQRSSPAFTTVQAFAAHYNAAYGAAADGLRTLWESSLDTPYNALCSGPCSGAGDTADPFDLDNDIGTYYAAAGRRYQQATGSLFTAPFWQLYKTISSGASGDAHDRTAWGNYASGSGVTNKFGNNRWYRYVAPTTGSKTIQVGTLGGGALCTSNNLDMIVYKSGSPVSWDTLSSGSTAGCPKVTFSATAGDTYVISVKGVSSGAQVSSWVMNVSP